MLDICNRLFGGSVRDCRRCKLPNEGGWLECPTEARGILVPASVAVAQAAAARLAPPIASNREIAKAKGFTGNVCDHCGGTNMKMSGTCEVCDDCGESHGGCS